ncbi:DNA-binding transcriptional LysR family regulator [Mesorhizobium sp. RMAD-H1]|nr:DNA-binding transcriptional LysR family regulator [Mesorhizobium sp. RMAD-H1]
MFLSIIEAGSITHGAAGANLSLAAASERLRDMELTAGVKLLERGRRGTVPTEAGEALAYHARLILRQVVDMQSELGERAKGMRATIRLLVNTAAMTEFLPDRLGTWLAAHPRVDVDLRERQSPDIIKAISAGLAEVGIISDAVAAAGLCLKPFAVDNLLLIVPRSHALASKRQVSFAQVLDEQFIGLAQGALQDHINGHAAQVGRRLSFRARVRTFEGICTMVAQGAGIGIVPERAARRCRRSMPLVSVQLRDPWATRRLSLCYRPDEELPVLTRNLLSHLKEGYLQDRAA